MRAPGTVQGHFALESALDELSYELGIDPTPLLDVVATVLRIYADGLERPHHRTTRDHPHPGCPEKLCPFECLYSGYCENDV